MTTQNSLNNETYDAPFVANSRPAGAVAQIISRNNDNTNAGSSAFVASSVAGAVAGDPYMLTQVAGVTAYSWGIDNSDSDTLKESTGAVSTPSSGTTLRRMTTAGEQTLPLQPAFFAFLSATDANVTGAGTSFNFGSGNALTVTQQGTSMATNGTFTAPVTGWYLFTTSIVFDQVGAANNSCNVIFFVNGASVFFGTGLNPGVIRDTSNALIQGCSNIIRLTAGDTVVVRVAMFGGAGDTVDIRGGGSNTSTFSGALLF